MESIEEMRSAVAALRSEIEELAAIEEITPEDDARLDAKLDELTIKRDAVSARETREARIAEVRASAPVASAGTPQPFHAAKPIDSRLDVRSAAPGEVRDAARKILDEARFVSDENRETAERALFARGAQYNADAFARHLVVSESPEYRSAFFKSVTGSSDLLDDSERRAISEFRANALSPATAGGLGVPVLIDPTIMITSGTGLLGVLGLARIESITNDEWKGVSAAHTAWSFDAEAAEVSNDASELAQPKVPVHTARGFIPYSIEIGMDYPGFASEMSKLLASGYADLLANKLAVGSGSAEPFGVFTGVNAVTNSRVAVTTAGTFGAPDIDKVWSAVPEKFRDKASWFMSVDVNNRIRAFAAGNNHNRFTVDQTADGAYILNGKRVVLSDFAPDFVGVTAGTVRNVLVCGDFEQFLVAQRVGMNVEYIPHLFGTTNNRPTGQRGWFAYARVGADVVVPNGLRVLRNT